jgi:hypothetical protein
MTDPTVSGLCGFAIVTVTAENDAGSSAPVPSDPAPADLTCG